MKKKMPKINVQVVSAVHVIGGYDRESSSSTFSTKKTVIMIDGLINTFENDPNQFQAIKFINKKFASQKLAKIDKEYEKCKKEILKLEQKMTKLLNKKRTYLVPVKVQGDK